MGSAEIRQNMPILQPLVGRKILCREQKTEAGLAQDAERQARLTPAFAARKAQRDLSLQSGIQRRVQNSLKKSQYKRRNRTLDDKDPVNNGTALCVPGKD